MLHIILSVSLLLSLLIGGIVLQEKRIAPREKVFFLGCVFGTLLWGAGVFSGLYSPVHVSYHSGDRAYIIMQILYFGAGFVVFSQYWFLSLYKNFSFKFTFQHYVSVLLFLVFCGLVAFPNTFFSEMEFSPERYVYLKREPWIHFFVFYLLFFYASSFSLLLKRIKKSTNPIYKKQFQILLISFLLFNISVLFTNMILPTYFHMPQFNIMGPTLYIIEAVFFFYAATRLRFLDIQLTLQKYATHICNGLTYVGPVLVMFYFASKDGEIPLALASGTILLLLGGTIAFGKKTFSFWDRCWNHMLYGTSLNPLQRIRNSLQGFATSLSEGLCLLASGLNIEQAQFVGTEYVGPSLRRFFSTYPDAELVREEVDIKLGTSPTKQLREIRADMDRYMVSVAIPVFDRDRKLLGVLFLKQKLDDMLFSAQELRETRILLEKATIYFTPEHQHEEIKQRLGNPQVVSKEFLNNLMHEIRTPLMMAQNVKEMIEWGRLKPEDKEFLSESEESIQELTRKLDRISDAFQWQQKLIPLEKSFISLEALFDFLIRDFSAAKILISVEISSPALKKKLFLMDTTSIKSAFKEIIQNSLFFCKQKIPRVQIKVSQKEKKLNFVFEDNGIGINPSHWNSIFDLLSVVAESRNPRECGLGVGLTKAKGVIESHGGEIKIIKSELGKGTTFQVVIPCEEIKA